MYFISFGFFCAPCLSYIPSGSIDIREHHDLTSTLLPLRDDGGHAVIQLQLIAR